MEEESESLEDLRVSRSQKKRADEARQVLAHRIVALHERALRRLPLSADALAAAETAAAIPQHVAHRRAVMYLASLLRSEDEAAIRLALEEPVPAQEPDPVEEMVEDWYDRLLQGDSACLEEIASSHPDLDWTHARQLIRNAVSERRESGRTGGISSAASSAPAADGLKKAGSRGRAETRLRAYLLGLAREGS